MTTCILCAKGMCLRAEETIAIDVPLTVILKSATDDAVLRAVVHKNRLKLDKQHMKVTTVNADEGKPMLQASELRALPRRVRLELGTVEMTVGELSDMQPDRSLSLTRS